MLPLLVAAALTYVGNDACQGCHPSIYASYMRTPMALSSGGVRTEIVRGSFRHAASGIQYSIESSGVVEWKSRTMSGQRRLEYFIGSGAAGRSYLWTVDRFLFQAPVTWYSQQNRWDVSPGFERDTTARWSRAIEPNCLFCHASQPRPIYGTQNQYAEPPFAQGGVGCERCHGPGSEHIAGRGGIVNPAKLESMRRDAVCSQCHLSGAARIEKTGQRIAAFRPGQNLDDYVAFFVPAHMAGGDMKATGHAERLEQSACKQVSGDKLWCGTCHDPHTIPDASKRTAWYREKCLSCHQRSDCRRGPDCVSCHMPRERVVDGGHGVLTDHSIRRSARKGQRFSGRWQLQPFRGFTATVRELGLAYAEVSDTSGDAQQRCEAERLLRTVTPDAQVWVRLGDLRWRRNDPIGAATAWESVLKLDPNSVVALVNLGAARGSAGDLAGAEALWKRALEKNPGQMEAGRNLYRLYRNQGRRNEAEALRARLRRFEPGIQD